METFGQALRRWRESAGMSQPQLAQRVPISQASLSRWENDKQAVGPTTADRLDKLVGANGALRALLQSANPAATVLTPDDNDRLAHVADKPRTVDSHALDSLAKVLAEQRRLEDAMGAVAVLEPTRGYTQLMERLVLDARGPSRPAVVNLAAQWAQFSGWLHAAMNKLPASSRWFGVALEWATEVDDRTMISTVLSFKGHLAWKGGHIAPMIGLSQAAQRDNSAYVGQLTFAAMQEARGHAMTGDAETCDRKMDAASQLAEKFAEQTDDAPPWIYFYSPPFFTLQRGLINSYLGRNSMSAAYLAAGLDALPEEDRNAQWTGFYRRRLVEVQAAL